MASIREAQRFHQEVLDSHGNEKESIDRLRKMWLESEQEARTAHCWRTRTMNLIG